MSSKIKVLIADDVAATRENIYKLMEFHPEMNAVGQAGSGEEAIALARRLQPDVVLMDINMPGMDGITATERLTTEVPGAAIIIMSVQAEQDYLRRAMIAGAKNYLIKPFTGDELLTAVRQAYAQEQRRKSAYVNVRPTTREPGKLISIFSSKGGVGKTTIATNLAVALAEKTSSRVALVDADLQFGDVTLFLNLAPRSTLADMISDVEHLDATVLDSYTVDYNERLRVLPAPFRPEQAETITGAHMTAILKQFRASYPYTVIDTAATFNETTLAVLDASDIIYMIVELDLPTVKNVKLGLEIMQNLGYGPEKVQLILNRSGSEGGMDTREVEESLKRTFAMNIPSDGKVVVSSVNRGIPFVKSHPQTLVAQRIMSLAGRIAQQDGPDTSLTVKKRRFFG